MTLSRAFIVFVSRQAWISSSTDVDNKPKAEACPGSLSINGYGDVSIVPTGWYGNGQGTSVLVSNGREVAPQMEGRAYFAHQCTVGSYSPEQYMTHNLLSKSIKYSVDLLGAGCGCNAAFYLTSMGQNKNASQCHDYYCDANNVCGESCTEIDIMEANQYAWHSTVHSKTDHAGLGKGIGGGGPGWSGPRDWTGHEYGPHAKCINTLEPFNVAVAFPVDTFGDLIGMEVTLSQKGKPCNLNISVSNYTNDGGMAELYTALKAGMTPIVSYWADDDMLWLDGKGADWQGPCRTDSSKACGDQVRMFDFSIESIPARVVPTTTTATTTDSSAAKLAYDVGSIITIADTDSETEDLDAKDSRSRPTAAPATCPGEISAGELGQVSLIPTGWHTNTGGAAVNIVGGHLAPTMGSRAYFANKCVAGTYDTEHYVIANFLGSSIRYTTDLSGVGCGCNAAFYLTSMGHSKYASECHDYYCDAHRICGQACTEIDIQESNQHAWHSTLHASVDRNGLAAGFGGGGPGWNGLRNWTASQYGPGAKCIDTTKPFDVSVSFPTDANGDLAAMEIELVQTGSPCPLKTRLADYTVGQGMKEMTAALKAGMTPVVSYWSDANLMWFDGKGEDGKGSCKTDSPALCANSVKFYDFRMSNVKKLKAKPQTHGSDIQHPVDKQAEDNVLTFAKIGNDEKELERLSKKAEQLRKAITKTNNNNWDTIGKGCCNTATVSIWSQSKPLFDGLAGDLQKCKAKCLEFKNCGFVNHGWQSGSSPRCAIWSDDMDCTHPYKWSGWCDDGVHAFKWNGYEDDDSTDDLVPFLGSGSAHSMEKEVDVIMKKHENFGGRLRDLAARRSSLPGVALALVGVALFATLTLVSIRWVVRRRAQEALLADQTSTEQLPSKPSGLKSSGASSCHLLNLA